MKNKKSYPIDELLNIMDELREKCPWDKEQTMDSLKILTIEESYELTEGETDLGTGNHCHQHGQCHQGIAHLIRDTFYVSRQIM